jgi:transposase
MARKYTALFKSKNEALRQAILALHHTHNFSYARIAAMLSQSGEAVNTRLVERTIARWKHIKSTSDQLRSGRKRSTTFQTDVLIKKVTLDNPTKSLQQLRTLLKGTHRVNISENVLAARLKEQGLISKICPKKASHIEKELPLEGSLVKSPFEDKFQVLCFQMSP